MTRLAQLPVARQVIQTFGLIIIFLAATGALFFFSLSAIERHNDELQSNTLQKLKISSNIAANLGALQAEILRHVLTTSDAGMVFHERIIRQMRAVNAKEMAEYERLIGQTPERLVYARVREAQQLFAQKTDSLLVLSRQNKLEKVAFAISAQAPVYDECHNAIQALVDLSGQMARTSAMASTRLILQTRITTLALLGLAIVIIVGTGREVLSVARKLNADNRKLNTEILERKEAENLRRLSEARYQLLFECAPDGIVIADPGSTYLDANPSICRMLGYARAEIIGLHASNIVSPKEIEHIAPALGALAKGTEYHREWQFQRKDGSFFEAEVIAATLPDGNLLGMIRDITERRLAQERIRQMNADLEERVTTRTAELEAANKELEAFSYSVSHDLRAPLRAVNGFAGIVLESYSEQLPTEGRRYLEKIRESGQRMGELIDDLLGFSRLSRQSVGRFVVDMNSLAQEVFAELKSQSDGRQIEFEMEEMPPCQGDPALLKQVWINLLSNAIKYTRFKRNARIVVGCTKEHGENIYFVSDNGAGFDMEYSGRLFGVFQRLHSAAEFEGTGVGLANVQRIVNRHGGRIWAKAEVDRGASFYFTIGGGTRELQNV